MTGKSWLPPSLLPGPLRELPEPSGEGTGLPSGPLGPGRGGPGAGGGPRRPSAGPGKRGSSRRGPDAGAVYSFFPSSVPCPSAGGRGALSPGGGGGLADPGRERAGGFSSPGRAARGSRAFVHAPLAWVAGAGGERAGLPRPARLPPQGSDFHLGGARAGGWASGKVGQGCAPSLPHRGLLPELHFLLSFLRPLLEDSLWATNTWTKIKTGYSFLAIHLRLPFSGAEGLKLYLRTLVPLPPNYLSLLHSTLCLRVLQTRAGSHGLRVLFGKGSSGFVWNSKLLFLLPHNLHSKLKANRQYNVYNSRDDSWGAGEKMTFLCCRFSKHFIIFYHTERQCFYFKIKQTDSFPKLHTVPFW